MAIRDTEPLPSTGAVSGGHIPVGLFVDPFRQGQEMFTKHEFPFSSRRPLRELAKGFDAPPYVRSVGVRMVQHALAQGFNPLRLDLSSSLSKDYYEGVARWHFENSDGRALPTICATAAVVVERDRQAIDPDEFPKAGTLCYKGDVSELNDRRLIDTTPVMVPRLRELRDGTSAQADAGEVTIFHYGGLHNSPKLADKSVKLTRIFVEGRLHIDRPVR